MRPENNTRETGGGGVVPVFNQLNWNVNSGPPVVKLNMCPLLPPPIPPNPIPSNPPNMVVNIDEGSKSAGIERESNR